jgi:hypothetical protein
LLAGVSIAVACVLATLIVGGSLAFVAALSRDENKPEVEPAEVRPTVVKAKKPKLNNPVKFVANRSRARLPLAELPWERAIKEVYQTTSRGVREFPAGTSRIDELVFGKLKEKGITPAAPCSDSVFIRRVYLDVIGSLPTALEVTRFLEDKAPDKREKLIDRLLERKEGIDYRAMKWADLLRVKSEFPINLWPNAVQAYHEWIRTSLRENLPYDKFARTLLTSSGSNFREPPVNFYRALQRKDAKTTAAAVALTFMGVRPEGWPKERWSGMEAFFSRIGYKATLEWKEEIVFFDARKPLTPTQAIFPDGNPAQILPDQDPREVFAGWLISPKNPWFTRNIANRVWSWLVGRGIIHEPDDIRPDNPPSHPELLAHLEKELIAADYDLKKFYRLILNSRTYQLSSVPASKDPRAAALFAYYPVRRLEAEVLIDAICQVTGTTEKYYSPIPEPFTWIPEEKPSISLADGSITSPFLEMFGRPPRDSGLEAERNNNFTAAQRVHLLNSSHIQRKLENGPALRFVLNSSGTPREIIDQLYLTILSRYPTKEEREAVSSYSQTYGDGAKPGFEIAWALINTAEFLCRH